MQWNQVWFCRLHAFASFTAFMRLNDEKSAHYVNLSIGKLVFSNQLIFSAHILAVFFPFFFTQPDSMKSWFYDFSHFCFEKMSQIDIFNWFLSSSMHDKRSKWRSKKANTKQKQKRCHLVSWCTLFVIKPFFLYGVPSIPVHWLI